MTFIMYKDCKHQKLFLWYYIKTGVLDRYFHGAIKSGVHITIFIITV